MAHEFILDAVYAGIEQRNARIASELSLKPNSPDNRGRTMVRQAADSLELDRFRWENLDIPVKKGDAVEIPAGIPVGIVPFGGYVTTQIIRGILSRTHSLIGGAGYMEHGRRDRKEALFLVTVSLGEGEGTIGLLVPSWYRSLNGTYSAVLQKSLGNSPIAQIAA